MFNITLEGYIKFLKILPFIIIGIVLILINVSPRLHQAFKEYQPSKAFGSSLVIIAFIVFICVFTIIYTVSRLGW